MALDLVAKFGQKKVLLIGDAHLDVYLHGTTSGIALGTTVPRIHHTETIVTYGGNGLVANNLLELGATTYFVSVVGDDEDARYYHSFSHPKLKKHFFVDPSRRTTVKRRIFADGQRLFHLNSVDTHDIGPKLERAVGNTVQNLVGKSDVVVIMDPQQGLLTKGLIARVRDLCKKYRKPLHVDTQIAHKKSNHHIYRGVDTMFLNELEAVTVYQKFDMNNLPKSLEAIRKKFNVSNVVVKLGSLGSAALFGDNFIRTAAYPVNAVDPVGAGDAFLAAFSLGDRNRLEDTLRIANIWGGLSTTIPGTTPAKKKDLVHALKGKRSKKVK